MNEIEIQNRLPDWLRKHFKDSELLIEKEVQLNLGLEQNKFITDLVAVQSKSNVIHAFEIKNKLTLSSINSLLWQIDSLYGNYKWLVTFQEYKYPEIINKLKEKGLGLIVFSKNDFEIVVKPKYIDGNLIKFYPVVFEKWKIKNKNYGSNSRSKNKN